MRLVHYFAKFKRLKAQIWLFCPATAGQYVTPIKSIFVEKKIRENRQIDLLRTAALGGSMTSRGISYPVFGRSSGQRERQVHHHFEGKRAGFYPWKGDGVRFGNVFLLKFADSSNVVLYATESFPVSTLSHTDYLTELRFKIELQKHKLLRTAL
jgi:hypothetical protein